MSPHEECAVEEAVRLIAKHGGRSTVLTVGPAAAEEQLRYAMSMGSTMPCSSTATKRSSARFRSRGDRTGRLRTAERAATSTSSSSGTKRRTPVISRLAFGSPKAWVSRAYLASSNSTSLRPACAV